jgi:uncharacterized protein (UPF0332 family)
MSTKLRQLVQERKLIKARITREMISKEIEAARSDLGDARASLDQGKLKWATIQGYYSMFHSARSLLYSKSYREKSHYALSVAIEELFSNDLEADMINAFRDAMDLRQEADYGLKFSQDGATETIENADLFLEKAKKILKI